MTASHDDAPMVSLVIPAFNEEAYLHDTLAECTKMLRKKPFSSEIIVVDDGSTDRTPDIAAGFSAVRVLSNDTNRGKGFSVRRGMLAATGKFRVFMDADMSVTIMELENILPALKGWPQRKHDGGADLAIATRRAVGARIAKRQPLLRHLAGIVYGLCVNLLFHTGVRDCQCGFKGFTAAAAERVFSAQTIDGFAFDTELIVLARRWGLEVAQIPVVWWDRPGTTVSAIRHGPALVRDLLRIRANLRAGAYDAPTSA